MQTNILVRFSPLIAYAICAIVIWLVSFLLSKFISIKNLSKFSLVLASILVLLSFIKTDMKADASIPSTSNTQNLIRLSAPTLKSKLPAKSILLTSTDMMQDDDLYFMYWTGFDSLEVRQYQPLDILIKLVPANQPLYLVSDKLQTRLPSGITSQPEFRVPFGYVYKIH